MHTFEALTSYEYARYAFVAAWAIGLVCSLLSVLIVLKRMAFIGQGISHAGFGGVGTAALLGFTATPWMHDLIVLAFCLVTALGIGVLVRRRRVQVDSAIGILLAATMAWGVLAQNLRIVLQDWPAYRQWIGAAGYTPPWESILFGSLLDVGRGGMWAAVIMCVLVLAVCAVLYRHLLFFAFDETVSRVHGVRSDGLYYLLLILLAIVIVVSIRLVGVILVSALLIVPGATAMMLSRRMVRVLLLAALVGLVGTIGGLVLSFELGNISVGAAIVLVLFVIFCAACIFSRLRRGQVRPRVRQTA